MVKKKIKKKKRYSKFKKIHIRKGLFFPIIARFISLPYELDKLNSLLVCLFESKLPSDLALKFCACSLLSIPANHMISFSTNSGVFSVFTVLDRIESNPNKIYAEKGLLDVAI